MNTFKLLPDYVPGFFKCFIIALSRKAVFWWCLTGCCPKTGRALPQNLKGSAPLKISWWTCNPQPLCSSSNPLEKEHAVFKRDGNDLHYSTSVSLKHALCGDTTLHVPSITHEVRSLWGQGWGPVRAGMEAVFGGLGAKPLTNDYSTSVCTMHWVVYTSITG